MLSRDITHSIGYLVFPIPLICEILLVGSALLWFTRRQQAGKVLVSLGTGLLFLLGIQGISAMLVRPLEQCYPPLVVSPRQGSQPFLKAGMFIVVLSGGYSTDPHVDILSHLSGQTAVRVLKGVLLYKEVPGCKLILSGGPRADAESMAQVALRLGVKKSDVVLESRSTNTRQEAVFIAPMVGKAPFVLVTSALHMQRAMGLFRHLGMNPIAAPTDYLAQDWADSLPDKIYPGSYGLYEAERAVYEYLGIVWEKLIHER